MFFNLDNNKMIIKVAEDFARKFYAKFDPSHDFLHAERVRKLALKIANDPRTPQPVDVTVVELAALLHDVGDLKYNNEGFDGLRRVLLNAKCPEVIVERVITIADNISYRKEMKRLEEPPTDEKLRNELQSPEFLIVQDADRLDAIGAIGVARTFAFGSARNRPFYDAVKQDMEQYHSGPYSEATLDHFFDKLFKLKSLMKTPLGKELARRRHEAMKLFVDNFISELK